MGTLCRVLWICGAIIFSLTITAAESEEPASDRRGRRYLAGEEGGLDGSVGGPSYTQPINKTEGKAGHYLTTKVQLPSPSPTASLAAANVTSTAAAAAPVTNVTGGLDITAPLATAPAILQPAAPNATASASLPATPSDDLEEVQPDSFPEIFTNQTLKNHNITNSNEDHHLYYNSTIIDDEDVARSLWVDGESRADVHVNQMLSQSHRKAATVQLSFDFPFYGHPVRNVTVATGGFLYTGEYIHSWLAATQYVAPLMANFDTSLAPDSFVKYFDNGTAFTVQWVSVRLQDRPEAGPFSFQVTLHRSGDMVFVYREVPFPITDIMDDQHPVKVGISDAYIIDRTIFFVRRKTIYEYHRVHLMQHPIGNWTVVILKALPTCMSLTNCQDCLTSLNTFQCQWCKGRCSDGVDRRRQEWLQHQCDRVAVDSAARCPPAAAAGALPEYVTGSRQPVTAAPAHQEQQQQQHASASRLDGGPPIDTTTNTAQGSSLGVSGAVAVLCAVVLVAAVGVWLLYAYRNPHTASGQFLIRYRPSQWSWRRGEARYTAATIHM